MTEMQPGREGRVRDRWRGVSRAVGRWSERQRGRAQDGPASLPGRQPGAGPLKQTRPRGPEGGFGEDDGLLLGMGCVTLQVSILGAGCPNAGSSWRGPGDAETFITYHQRRSLEVTEVGRSSETASEQEGGGTKGRV